MSVLIKGMDMPTNCFYCPLSVLGGERLFCGVTKDEVVRMKRSSDCPMVEVKAPHGRLIDADALAMKWIFGQPEKREIQESPTIIEAEETRDTVRVVRCKDCKHRDPEDKKCDCGHDIQWQLPRQDGWFCADGERREVDDG